MTQQTYRASVVMEPKLRKQADKLAGECGITFSHLVRLLLQRAIEDGKKNKVTLCLQVDKQTDVTCRGGVDCYACQAAAERALSDSP